MCAVFSGSNLLTRMLKDKRELAVTKLDTVFIGSDSTETASVIKLDMFAMRQH